MILRRIGAPWTRGSPNANHETVACRVLQPVVPPRYVGDRSAAHRALREPGTRSWLPHLGGGGHASASRRPRHGRHPRWLAGESRAPRGPRDAEGARAPLLEGAVRRLG